MILFRWNKHKQKTNIPSKDIKPNMYEKDFVDAFLNDGAVRRIFSDNYLIMREFESASGIPDVMLINRKHAANLVEFTNSFSDVRITQAHAKVILSLNRRSYISVGQLNILTGYSESYIKNILDGLKSSNIVLRNERGWKLSSDFRFPKVETISLEFKLSDWQSALKQGFRYRKLSTRSFVVMPADKTELLKRNRSRFANLDVGALTYSHITKKAEVISKPSRCSPSNSSFFGSFSSISDFAVLHSA